MKVAELYAQLGIKVDQGDLAVLKQFETTLNGIAAAARNAALALKLMAKMPVPRSFGRLAKAGAAASAPAPASETPSILGDSSGQGSFLSRLTQMFGKSLLRTLGIATLAMAISKLTGAIKNMAQASMAAAFGVDKFTSQTGLSREELKRWEYVAALSDVTAEELQDTMKGLQQRARQIQFTGEGATPFLQLGISPMSSPSEILRQFAQRTRAMDMGTAVYFGKLVGISENMVYMLRKNVDNLDKLVPDQLLTEKQQKAMMELNVEWAKFTFNLGLLRDRFIADLAPALRTILELTDRMLDWNFSKREAGTAGRTFMSPTAMAFPGLLGSMNAAGTTINNNFDTKIENQGTGNARADGKALGEAFTQEVKAFYQRRPTFIGAGL